jgi:hypothetical protein
MSTPALDGLIDRLNECGVRVAWIPTMPHPGVFVREHQFVVLAADRSHVALARALHAVLDRLDYRDELEDTADSQSPTRLPSVRQPIRTRMTECRQRSSWLWRSWQRRTA